MTNIQVHSYPADEYIMVHLTSYKNHIVTCTLYDRLGMQVHKKSVFVYVGDNEFTIDMDIIGKGVCFINIASGDGKNSTSLKVIKETELAPYSLS
jgi:hypothetical protein